MANIFSLDPDVKDIVAQVLDDLLANGKDGGFGKTCLLVYPPKNIPCDNCVYDSISNRSSNRPLSGCPQPFSPGCTCPVCNGKGIKQMQVSEEVTFLCNWEPKKFTHPFPANTAMMTQNPYSYLETKGFIQYIGKVKRCSHLIFQTELNGYGVLSYKLLCEPGDRSNIIQGRYFYALWERVN